MSKKEIEVHVDKDNKIDLHEFIEMKIKYDEEYFKKDKEIEKLNNIINELEKWLEVNLTNLEKEKANNTYDKGLKQGMLSNGRLIKNKLQELKGSDSNVKD